MIENLVDKIPDAWFDWFGRFLPGCYALGILIWVHGSVPQLLEVTIGSTALLVLAAYVLGNFIQPPSSYVLRKIQSRWPEDENLYSKAKNTGHVQTSLDKVSKAHAEGAGMLACFYFSITAHVYFRLKHSLGHASIFWLVAVYFLLMGYERALARHRKIDALGK